MKLSGIRRSMRIFVAVGLLGLAGASSATITTYTSQSSFLAATTGDLLQQTVNFDALSAGTQFASGTGTGGLTFSYSLGGATLQVDNSFPTTSGSNYLGLDIGGAFNINDGFTVTFAHPINAVGLYILAGSIGGGFVYPGDFTLSVAQGSVSNPANWSTVLSDGNGTAYYLGLVTSGANASFSSVTLSSGTPNSQFYSFNVDDISSAVSPVPELSSGVLTLLGIGLLSGLHVWRRRTHAIGKG